MQVGGMGGTLAGPCGVCGDGICAHGEGWAEPVHVDVAELGEFFRELWGKDFVKVAGEVAQGVGDRKFKFLVC
jgi:hypothetical protein